MMQCCWIPRRSSSSSSSIIRSSGSGSGVDAIIIAMQMMRMQMSVTTATEQQKIQQMQLYHCRVSGWNRYSSMNSSRRFPMLPLPQHHVSTNDANTATRMMMTSLRYHSTTNHSSSSTTTTPPPTPTLPTPIVVIPKDDKGPYREYSVIHTDRSLNLMSPPFQTIMQDLYRVLTTTYHAAHAIIIPGYVVLCCLLVLLLLWCWCGVCIYLYIDLYIYIYT
jgi:hypothetical protein